MDEIGTRTHFIRAWTTYLHGPSTDKMGAGAKLYFIRAVLQIERSARPIYRVYKKKGNPTLACHCVLIAGCKKRNFCTAIKSKVLTVE